MLPEPRSDASRNLSLLRTGIVLTITMYHEDVYFILNFLLCMLHPQAHTLRHTPQQNATAADGTHPTGMHSCCQMLVCVKSHCHILKANSHNNRYQTNYK